VSQGTLYGDFNNNYMKQLTLRESFDLKLKVKNLIIKKMKDILDFNHYKYDIKDTQFEGFYEVIVKNVTITKAERLRALMKSALIIDFA